MRRNFLPVLIVLLELSACSTDSDGDSRPVRTAEFEDLFVEAARIQLDEKTDGPIGRLNEIDVAPDGRIVTTDFTSDRVRVFSATGMLIDSAGGNGQGPGEFTFPSDAVFTSDGSIFVMNFAPPRITRFTSDLEFDTVFSIPDVQAIHDLYTDGERLLVHLVRRIPEGFKYVWYSRDGERLKRFHGEHVLIGEIPYWRNATNEIAAVSDDKVFIANEILYPIYRYGLDGALVDSFGIRPPSWVQASKLRVGQFSGPRSGLTFAQWRRSFTSVHKLNVYRDSLLMVSHQRLNPEQLAYWDGSYTLDIYQLDGRKLYADVALPGEMLSKSHEYIYLLLTTPPHGWTLGKYRLREDS